MAHHHHHHGGRSGSGGILLILGLVVGSPILIFWGIIEICASIAAHAATITAASTMSAAAVPTLLFTASLIVGYAALAVYCIVGLIRIANAAVDTYYSDKSVKDLIKSNIFHKDKLGFLSVINSIEGILLSPFIIMGVLIGKGVKAAAQVCIKKSQTDKVSTEIIEDSEAKILVRELSSPTNPLSANLISNQKPGQYPPILYDKRNDMEKLGHSTTEFSLHGDLQQLL